MDKHEIPEWDEVAEKADNGYPLDPLEKFVLDNEPAGHNEEIEFRKGLEHLVRFIERG